MNKSFLCFAMHQLPSPQLLNSWVNYRNQGAYGFNILSSKGKVQRQKKNTVIQENDIVLTILNGGIGLLPLNDFLSPKDAPYGLIYDFMLKSNCQQPYNIIGQYDGFTIVTLPQHDWARSENASHIAERILYADRAILNLSERRPITDVIEKNYTKFAKLRNLYLSQPESPEGQLAAQRALESATRCYQAFTIA